MSNVTIDGTEYVPKDEIDEPNYDYVLVRADKAGVFVGYLKERDGSTIVLTKCRKLWYWTGANAVQEIAKHGVANPGECKFTVTVSEQMVFGAIEIIPCTQDAKKSIAAVEEWTYD